MLLRKLFWMATKAGIRECSHLGHSNPACLENGKCITAKTRKYKTMNNEMYQVGFPYGIKVLVEDRWCFVEFHPDEPTLEALRKNYGTDKIRIRKIGNVLEDSVEVVFDPPCTRR